MDRISSNIINNDIDAQRKKETINITPTWRGLAPMLIELVGGNAETDKAQRSALKELSRVVESVCKVVTVEYPHPHETRTEARALIFGLCDFVDKLNKEGK